jgi:crossover junction endodeoxyribonuclease RusA
MPRVSFFVPGIPAAQGSKKHVGHGVMVETVKSLPEWRRAVIAATQPYSRSQFRGPVKLFCLFSYARPKAHYGTGKNAGKVKQGAPTFKATNPDLDKLCRAVADALQIAGILQDDSQIVILEARKLYGHPYGVRVEVTDV